MLDYRHRRGPIIAADGLFGPALAPAVMSCGPDITYGGAVVQSQRLTPCKAIGHLGVAFNSVVQAVDATIPYAAELADVGTVIVTADLR